MADTKNGGAVPPADKKGKEGSESVENGKGKEKDLSEPKKRAVKRRRLVQRGKLQKEMRKIADNGGVKKARAEDAGLMPRTREELHPRAFTAGKKAETTEAEKKPALSEEKEGAKGGGEVAAGLKAEESGPAEKQEPAGFEHEEEPEQIQPVTYFAHPFGPREEVTPETAPEDEISIGPKEEKPPPVVAGKMREEERPSEEEPPSEGEPPLQTEGPVAAEPAEKGQSVETGEAAKAGSELLAEKKAPLAGLKEFPAKMASWFKGKAPGFFRAVRIAAGKAGGAIRLRVIFGVFLVAAVAGGVYWSFVQQWPQAAVSYVTGFFTPKVGEKEEEIAVITNPEDLRMFGLVSASIFAGNGGSVNDLVPVQVQMADYFGRRLEPKVKGETGISAATYYGELKDSAGAVNQFIEYMEKLQEMQNLYNTDVYAMLDLSIERDKALLAFLEKLKAIREEGNRFLSGIRADMDGLKVSLESLNPDKTKYETDFFAAMESLESEKSDLLLKGFVDISQKQTALRARINALNKLITYYESALKRLDTRITAIEKNKDALIEGIRVVDVPGANLDIIIRPQASDKQS